MFILCLFVVSFVGILIAVVFMEISYLARFRLGVSHPCSLIDYSRYETFVWYLKVSHLLILIGRYNSYNLFRKYLYCSTSIL